MDDVICVLGNRVSKLEETVQEQNYRISDLEKELHALKARLTVIESRKV